MYIYTGDMYSIHIVCTAMYEIKIIHFTHHYLHCTWSTFQQGEQLLMTRKVQCNYIIHIIIHTFVELAAKFEH